VKRREERARSKEQGVKRVSSSLLCVELPSQVCHSAVLVDGEYVGLIGGVDCVGVVGGDV